MKKMLVVSCFVFLIGVSYANAVPLSTELVINGGAETGDTTGWTSTGIDAAIPPDVFSQGFGSFTFWGGTGTPIQTLLQTIDVSGNSAQIDAGEIESIFGINLQSRSIPGVLDEARVDISFTDGFGGVLDSFFFVDTINTGSFDWNFFSDTRFLSTGTRSIEVLLTSNRAAGISSDGFIDDISLQLNATGSSPAPVPEPSTMLLLGSGLIGLVGFNYKRNKKTI